MISERDQALEDAHNELQLIKNSLNQFLINISISLGIEPMCLEKFFEQNGITVDEDGFALSEMLQFIWRSAIRDGKEIWVYIPSVRMRNLLEQWIEENSI